MAKTIIGLIGRNGSGKDTAANMLAQKLNAQMIVYSGTINNALMIFLDKEQIGRDNQACMAAFLRGKYGDGIIAQGVKRELDKKPDGVYLLVGARDDGDYELVRSFPGSFFIVVNADVKIRWERVRLRKEKSDDDISFDGFLANESLASEEKVASLSKLADYVVDNSGTIKELEAIIDNVVRKIQSV